MKDFPAAIPEAVLLLTNAIQQVSPSARLILVGGSAFELHFPDAHASTDADLILHAVDAGPLAAFRYLSQLLHHLDLLGQVVCLGIQDPGIRWTTLVRMYPSGL